MRHEKLLALILAAVMLLALVSCGKTAEVKEDEKEAETTAAEAETTAAEEEDVSQIANPCVDYESLEEINEKIGCSLASPAVMGVTDEGYTVIGDTIAEYRFDVNGAKFCFRAAEQAEDISGVYDGDGTVFENAGEEMTFAEAEGFRLARWFDGGMQYVLMLTDEGETMEEETFEGVAEELQTIVGGVQ